MLIKTKTIQLKTDSKTQLFDLTEEVEQTLKEVGLQNGTGTISTLHTRLESFAQSRKPLYGMMSRYF